MAVDAAIGLREQMHTTAALFHLSHRRNKIRQHIVGSERMPVSVYYARTNEPNPTVAYHRTEARDRTRAQPWLLLVAGDGRMWAATPDIPDYQTPPRGRNPSGNTHRRNNPWIAPLYALVGGHYHQPVFDQAALAHRPLPVDLQAPAQERVRTALAALGQGQANDPRFVGGPVPGELLVPRSDGSFAPPYQTPRSIVLVAGLVLHRPANAPAPAPLDGFGWFEHLFFGTDPGICRGFYLSDLTPYQAAL